MEIKIELVTTEIIITRERPPDAKALPNQPTWVDLGLPDLRRLEREMRSLPLEEVPRAEDFEKAATVLFEHFGLIDPMQQYNEFETPIGTVRVERKNLMHIVEKRPDARERYVRYAVDTLTGPFEIWRIAYDNGCSRLAFIGAYEAKNQMLVMVAFHPDEVLWNFMHGDARAMNRHRQGELVYHRYEIPK